MRVSKFKYGQHLEEVKKRGTPSTLTILDFRHLPTDLPQNLSSPALALAHALARARHPRSAVRARPEAQLGRLGLAEAVEHRLRLLLITGLVGGSVCFVEYHGGYSNHFVLVVECEARWTRYVSN